ncbi:XRE family transcriptional regulator [Aquibium sp. A9E412]|uniref:helix-turn-helix domain-containing protein n=1 Tax=Aquibium sp. A9E412 TaxID=2976767 RepID=UPI0025AF28BA|nr:XRE family transcriptional regulator [Aquibium sp. A9E412]MDN2565421.1 XRE family transcriptional regulator [Aquibium sp. A9E412]
MNDAASGSEGIAIAHSQLGKRLRERRQELGLTLKEVASAAGLSVGFISQIERDITTPSLSSLASVSRVLGTDVGEFLSQPRGDAAATRRNQRPVYSLGGASLSYERLSASFPGNVLRSVIIHEPPGHRSEPIAHEGEEIFFLLDGAITVEVEGERTILEAGDSIHFPSDRTHSTWNHTDRPATILHTCTMDVFGDAHEAARTDPAPAVRRSSSRKKLPTARKAAGATGSGRPSPNQKRTSTREDKS